MKIIKRLKSAGDKRRTFLLRFMFRCIMFIDNQEEEETTNIFFLWEVESIKKNNEDAKNKPK